MAPDSLQRQQQQQFRVFCNLVFMLSYLPCVHFFDKRSIKFLLWFFIVCTSKTDVREYNMIFVWYRKDQAFLTHEFIFSISFFSFALPNFQFPFVFLIVNALILIIQLFQFFIRGISDQKFLIFNFLDLCSFCLRQCSNKILRKANLLLLSYFGKAGGKLLGNFLRPLRYVVQNTWCCHIN